MGLTRTAVRLGARAAPNGVPVLRRLVGAGLGGVFGDVPYDAERSPGDRACTARDRRPGG